jgi:hypothetical protein
MQNEKIGYTALLTSVTRGVTINDAAEGDFAPGTGCPHF